MVPSDERGKKGEGKLGEKKKGGKNAFLAGEGGRKEKDRESKLILPPIHERKKDRDVEKKGGMKTFTFPSWWGGRKEGEGGQTPPPQ